MPMAARAQRLARGWIVGLVATTVAAVSHSLAGGYRPGLLSSELLSIPFRRRLAAALLAFALGAAAAVAIASPASAHNEIVSSTPAPDETLTALPARFDIETNEALLDIGGAGRGFAFEIQDAAGRYYETGCVSIVDATIFTAARLGAPGSYTVIYQLVSADGHTASGRIPFTWAPSGTAPVTKGAAAPPGCRGGAGPARPTSGDGSETERNSTVPLADILWIGGIIVAIALAVIVTLLLVTRRRPNDGQDRDGDGDPDPTSS